MSAATTSLPQLDERLERMDRNGRGVPGAADDFPGDLVDAGELVRPAQPKPDQRAAQDRTGERDADRSPRPRGDTRGLGRLVDVEDARQAARLEHFADAGRQRGEPQRAFHALRRGVTADERRIPALSMVGTLSDR